MTRSLSKQKQKVALDLLHLLFVNKLRYNEKWECWTSYVIGSKSRWGEIPYPQLVNIAALLASGLTRSPASIEDTKILLQQIERWVTQSSGKLLEVRVSKHRTRWYPACLIDSGSEQELNVA